MQTTINTVTALLAILVAVLFLFHGHDPMTGAPFVPYQ